MNLTVNVLSYFCIFIWLQMFCLITLNWNGWKIHFQNRWMEPEHWAKILPMLVVWRQHTLRINVLHSTMGQKQCCPAYKTILRTNCSGFLVHKSGVHWSNHNIQEYCTATYIRPIISVCLEHSVVRKSLQEISNVQQTHQWIQLKNVKSGNRFTGDV